MVAADTRGLRIETLVIRRRTAGDEHTCAMPRELASDASTDACGRSSHHCGSAVQNHVRKCIGPGGGCLGKDGQAPAVSDCATAYRFDTFHLTSKRLRVIQQIL